MAVGTRRAVAILAVSILALVAADARSADGVDRQELSIDPNAAVSLDVTTHRVVVEGWDEPRLVMEMAAGSGTGPGFDIERRGRRVSVDIDPASVPGSTVRVFLPATVDLDIASSAGSITIDGLVGRVSIETLSGATRISGRPAELAIDSVGGSVDIADGAERLQVETFGGAVAIRGAVERAEIESVGGAVDMRLSAPIATLAIEAVNGRIEVATALARAARVELESHAGSIHVALPADTSARIRAASHHGNLDGDWSGAVERPREPGEDHQLDLTLGDGSAAVRLETHSGSIRLTRDR